MSIINNVLKDLELRTSQFTPIDIASVDRVTVDDNRSLNMPVVILFLLLAITAIGLWRYQLQYRYQAGAVINTESAIVSHDNGEVARSVPAGVDIVPNQIIGLQIRETSSDISLEFAMREKAVSYLKERSENKFVYRIRNIDSEIEAPQISGNRWIEEFSIEPLAQGGVDVTLQTVAGVLAKTEQFQKQGETIWTIKLENLPDPPVVAKLETVAAEKVPASLIPGEEKVQAVSAQAVGEPVKVEIKSASQVQSGIGQLNKAIQLMQERKWEKAESLLLGLLDGPLDLAARKQLLGIYAQLGNSNQYVDLARESSERYPQQGMLKTEYARSLFQQQAYLEVISLLQSVERLDSKQLALMAASYQRLDQHGKAIEYYYHSLKLNKQEARNWIGLGISLEHEAKLEKALQSYQAAARLGNINQRLKQFVEQRSRQLKTVIN